MEWLGERLMGLVLVTSVAITGTGKMITESYRPWECLCSLAIVRPTSPGPVSVYLDSAELRSFLATSEPPRVSSGIRDYASFAALAGTKCKTVRRTGLPCSNPRFTAEFVWIRITSGKERGHTGLVCEAELRRTVGMP